jgi:large subunit ribosomal protein L13
LERTYQAKPAKVERRWFVVDATDQTLGRIASRIASVLRGKHRPTFTPHVDTGDFVVVVNAHRIKLTGRKWDGKLYRQHSLYPGGLTTFTARQLLARHPEDLVRLAVKRMLPNTPLGRRMFRKLKVYAKDTHPHEAQQPQPLAAA